MVFKHICIVTAHDSEFKIAAGLLNEKAYYNEGRMEVCRGSFGDRQLTILKSGVGALGFAQRLFDHLQHNQYEALLVAGVAGALDPQIKTGDAVVFDSCYNARADRNGSNPGEVQPGNGNSRVIDCDDRLSRFIADTLFESGVPCIRAAGVTVDRIITCAKEKIALGIQYRAAAVDMETYDCLSVCAHFGLRASALRVVSDDAATDLPDFNRALERDGRMSNLRLATAIMMNPINSVRFLLNMRSVLDSLRVNLKTIYRTERREL
jgi:nucleoside phosphorylase